MNPSQATPVGNNVLVELQENDTLIYKSLKLVLPNANIPHNKIAYYCGRVVKTPKELDGTFFEWHTEMELQENDVIMFIYTAGQSIAAMDLYFEHDGKKYANIAYPKIYLRIRDGVIQGINGYIITEAIEKKSVFRNDIFIPKSGNEPIMSKVIAISTPNKGYRHSPSVDESTIDIEVGDIVFMDIFGAASIEMFQRIFQKEIYANQRKHIVGKINNKDMAYNDKNFKLFGDRLVVKVVTPTETKTQSGLIIPQNAVKREEVEVVHIGTELTKGSLSIKVLKKAGIEIPEHIKAIAALEVLLPKKGDKLLIMAFQLNDANAIEFEGAMHYFIPVNETTILAKIS